MEAQGVGHKIIVTDYGVRIEPTWKVGSQEVIEIPFSAIVSIRWKKGSFFARGWIQFLTAVDSSSMKTGAAPLFAPGVVVFKKSQEAAASELRGYVQSKIDERRGG